MKMSRISNLFQNHLPIDQFKRAGSDSKDSTTNSNLNKISSLDVVKRSISDFFSSMKLVGLSNKSALNKINQVSSHPKPKIESSPPQIGSLDFGLSFTELMESKASTAPSSPRESVSSGRSSKFIEMFD